MCLNAKEKSLNTKGFSLGIKQLIFIRLNTLQSLRYKNKEIA